jgi:hypothetical protein
MGECLQKASGNGRVQYTNDRAKLVSAINERAGLAQTAMQRLQRLPQAKILAQD